MKSPLGSEIAPRPSFFQFTFSEFQEHCLSKDLPVSAPRLLFNWHYKKNQRSPFTHQDLSQKAQKYFSSEMDFGIPVFVDRVNESHDGTFKFLFRLQDQNRVESVLIPFQNKYTLCISSQVGCAMKCAFCFTGTQGLTRNLSVVEIVGQYLEAKRWLTEQKGDHTLGDRILNIVFMGQGEPLHNFENVRRACDIFLSQHGLSLAPHKITVSTSGYLPGLRRWRAEMPNVNIALSLHSPFSEIRSQLIPLNGTYPLEQVLEALEGLPVGEKRFVTYQYLLLKDFNDQEKDAHAVGELLRGRRAYVNLIPFNPFPGAAYHRPELAQIEKFKLIVESYGIPTTLRTTKGDEILAACGQLNTKNSSNVSS